MCLSQLIFLIGLFAAVTMDEEASSMGFLLMLIGGIGWIIGLRRRGQSPLGCLGGLLAGFFTTFRGWR